MAFLPLGLLTALLLRRRYYGAFALAVTYLASLGAELLQYCLRVGSFDIDDVILTSVGGLLGILIAFTLLYVLIGFLFLKQIDYDKR